MSQRPRLSAIQLRRAVENAGGLWTAEELMRIGAMRFGDDRAELPPGVFIDGVTYRCGYDMLDYAERLGRAASAEAMEAAMAERARHIARHYANTLNPSRRKRVGVPYNGRA